ncbi:MAG: hypothetical protein Q7J05_04015 [Paludibacter sp.]|nr:hypothetical protein [Paludibacter sp.]
MSVIGTLKKIFSNYNGQTPSTGKEIEDAFNDNFTDVKESVNDIDVRTEDLEGAVVKHSEQSLTEGQKTQARTNISSVGVSDVLAVLGNSETKVLSQKTSTSVIYSQIAQIIKFHDPSLIFVDIVTTSTPTPSSGSLLNKAWLAIENGTVFGLTNCSAGQIIYNNGTGFKKEWPTNRANRNKMLPAMGGIFKEMKSTPVATAYDNFLNTDTPTSIFNGWRYKCNFIATFRVAEFCFSSSHANKNVIGYVWDENGNIVATSSVLTKAAGANVLTYYFIFDRDITSDLVGSKFWFGIRAEDFTTIIIGGRQVTGTEGGLLDLTVFEQYSTIEHGYDAWTNIATQGSRLPYLKLYNSDSINLSDLINQGITLISNAFSDILVYDSFSVSVNYLTQNGGQSYGSPFTGWGALFDKVGIDFNAISIPAIKRHAVTEEREWAHIQAVVKQSANGDIVALSKKIPVNSELATLTDVFIPLFNPGLTEVITLNDSSFTGSSYFIGYCFYNKDGQYAYGGTVNGTQTNFAGNSYYITDKTFEPSVPTSWAVFSGNPCIPIQHLLMSNAREIKHLIELDEINEKLNEIEEQLDLLSPEVIDISLPDNIYAVVGDTLQLFYRGMIKAPNPYIYDVLVSCSKGKQYPRYFEYLPVSGDVGTTTFKIEVKNKDGLIIGTKTCNLITRAAVQSPSTAKKILCVGDSLTSAGIWCQEASRRLVGSGGSPSGLALSNISFLGRKTGGGIGWEGTGGWSWDSYSTAGREAYKFIISGVTTSPSIGATYTNNGIVYTISEVNVTEGAGYVSALGTGAPTASGILTKATGEGDVTLSFSSSEPDAGNPFWESDTNSLDFPQYVNAYMGGSCDAIFFLLSWNAQTPHRSNFSSMITTAKTLIDHIHTNFPDCKIKIMGIQLPSLNGGMGANYGATGTSYADMYGNVVTVLNQNKAYQDWCNESAYSAFMEFVNVSAQFDSENNMPETDKVVNTRATKTEKIGTNGVHPSTEGYYQIGDVVFRNFVANFCQ